ncbi:MAG: hypothetical protein KatS3mg035_2171 [Bacteroidia bacterium]|nr:MAG: hypothetical protein KatS3mg035_2171 [Bacteroidia bacterium]
MTLTNLSDLGVNENTPVEEIRKNLDKFFNSNQDNKLYWDVPIKLKNNEKIVIEADNNIYIEFKHDIFIESYNQAKDNNETTENNPTILHLRGRKVANAGTVKLKDIKEKDYYFPVPKKVFNLINKKYSHVDNFIIYSNNCFIFMGKNKFDLKSVREDDSFYWCCIDNYYYFNEYALDDRGEDFYIYTSPKVCVKNLVLKTKLDNQLVKNKSKSGLRVDFGNSVEIKNCQISGFKYSGITCTYCYDTKIQECIVDSLSEDIGEDLMCYGINIASSHLSVIKNCCTFNCKHGISLGGKTPNYDTLIKNCIFKSFQEKNIFYAVLRTHNSAIATKVENCLFNGPLDHCGKDIYINNCQFYSLIMNSSPSISIKSQNKNAGFVIIENTGISGYWLPTAIYVGDGYIPEMATPGVLYNDIKIKKVLVSLNNSSECLRVAPQYGSIVINKFSIEESVFDTQSSNLVRILNKEPMDLTIKNLTISGTFNKKPISLSEDFSLSNLESYENNGFWVSNGKRSNKPGVKLRVKK